MTSKTNQNSFLINILLFSICFLPICLVLSRFLSEFILIIIVVNFIILNLLDQNSRKFYKSNFFKIFVLFNFILILSSIFSDSLSSSIRTSIFYFRFGFLVIVIQYLLEFEKRFINYFFYSLGLTLLVLSIYSFLQILVLNNAVDPNRISGFFGDELVQGSYFIRILPIYLGLLFLIKDFKFKNYLLISSVLIGVAIIILSGERAAIALTIMFLSLILFFYPVNIKRKVFSILILLTLFISIFSIFDGLKKRVITDTFSDVFEDNKLMIFSYGHQSHFKSAVQMIKNNYLTGIGPRNFRIECLKKDYEHIGKYRCSTHPHNTFLEVWAETGIFGFLIIFSILIYISVILTKVVLSKNKNEQTALFFFCLAIFINLFPFLPTGSFFNNWMSILYYLPVAFFIFENNRVKTSKFLNE